MVPYSALLFFVTFKKPIEHLCLAVAAFVSLILLLSPIQTLKCVSYCVSQPSSLFDIVCLMLGAFLRFNPMRC